jgi:hypothetical protein
MLYLATSDDNDYKIKRLVDLSDIQFSRVLKSAASHVYCLKIPLLVAC